MASGLGLRGRAAKAFKLTVYGSAFASRHLDGLTFPTSQASRSCVALERASWVPAFRRACTSHRLLCILWWFTVITLQGPWVAGHALSLGGQLLRSAVVKLLTNPNIMSKGACRQALSSRRLSS